MPNKNGKSYGKKNPRKTTPPPSKYQTDMNPLAPFIPNFQTAESAQGYVDYALQNQPGLYEYYERAATGGVGGPGVGGQNVRGVSGGGGRGRSGAEASRKQAAIDAIKSYYAAMQGVPTRSADALSALLSNARTLVDPKVASTRQSLSSQPNAMAELAGKLQPATQATNPLAEYLAAAGAGSSVSDSLVQLLNGNNQQIAAGQSNLVNTLAQSEASAQQSRIADVDQAALNFAMNLQNQEVQGRAAIEQENANRRQQLMDTILQMAAQYGIDLGEIGVKF